MDREHVRGAADKAKGDVHKTAGNVKDARAMPPTARRSK
jgi:uncharacterized protein YjbJ (UPF0337 family)